MNGYIWREIVSKRQDRLIAFFDAVLAIAITVLALEMVIPAVGNIGIAELKDFFASVTSYLISFVAMAMLWYIHTKFFSLYSLTGKSEEIVLHLILLFVVTLFQPATRAAELYRDDFWVRVMYIGIFTAMNLLNIVIMLVVRHNNDKADKSRNELKDIFKANKSDEYGEASRIMHIVYALNHPEHLMEIASDHVPEEFLKETENHSKMIKKQLRFSIIATVEMLVAIIAAVVLLTYSVSACYIALIIGAVVVFVSRIAFNRRKDI